EASLQAITNDLKAVKETYQSLEGKEEERTERKTRIRRLEEYLPIVKEVNQTKENLAKQSNQLGKIKQQLQQMAKRQAADEGNITERKQVIRRQEKEVEPLHEKQLEVMKLREQYKITRDAVEAVEKTTTSHRVLQEAEAL